MSDLENRGPNLRKVDPDCCANCVYLRWGISGGWDKCGRHDFGIAWTEKQKQVCDNHIRSRLNDPRLACTEIHPVSGG